MTKKRPKCSFLRIMMVLTLFSTVGIARASGFDDEVPKSFTIIQLGKTIRGLYYMNQEQEVEVIAYPQRRSKTYYYTGDALLVFYHKVPGEDGVDVQVPAGRFKFRGKERHWLLVFWPRDDGTYSIVGFPDDTLTQKTTAPYVFVNLTPDPLAGILGSQKFVLKPGKMKEVERSKKDEGEPSSRILLALRKESEWDEFYSNIWPVRQNQRWTILIVRIEDEDSVRVVKIPELINES